MSAELKVFLFAGAAMAFAYTALYPRLPKKTLMALFVVDAILTTIILLLVGMVYFGTATAFSLILFDVPWWLFAFLSAAAVELPLFIWFCKRWNIDLNPPVD